MHFPSHNVVGKICRNRWNEKIRNRCHLLYHKKRLHIPSIEGRDGLIPACCRTGIHRLHRTSNGNIKFTRADTASTGEQGFLKCCSFNPCFTLFGDDVGSIDKLWPYIIPESVQKNSIIVFQYGILVLFCGNSKLSQALLILRNRFSYVILIS